MSCILNNQPRFSSFSTASSTNTATSSTNNDYYQPQHQHQKQSTKTSQLPKTAAQIIQQRRPLKSNVQFCLKNPNEYLKKVVQGGKLDNIEKIVREIYQKASPDIKLHREIFHELLSAYTRRNSSKHIAISAFHIMQQMEQFYEAGRLDQPPNHQVYSLCLKALAKASHPEKAVRAEWILEDMEFKAKRGREELRPQYACFKSVIEAWADCSNPQKAEEVLVRMYRSFEEGNDSARPELEVFLTVMRAWSKEPLEQNAGERLEAILYHMEELARTTVIDVKPDKTAYCTVLNTWAKTGRIDRVEALIQQMEQRYKSGDASMKPDDKCYNIRLEALAKSLSEGPKAELALSSSLSEDSSSESDTTSLRYAIHGCAKAGDPVQAEEILNSMYDSYIADEPSVKATVEDLEAILQAWGRFKAPIASIRGEQLLLKMKEYYQAGFLERRPTMNCYFLVMKSFAKCGNAKKTEEIFQKMYRAYREGDKDAKPDRECFNLLLKTWAMSGFPHAGKQAEGFLELMIALHKAGDLDNDNAPNEASFHHVITAWAGSSGNPARAEAVLERVCKLCAATDSSGKAPALKLSIRPFEIVMGSWIRSSSYSAGEKADRLLKRINELQAMGLLPISSTDAVQDLWLQCWQNSGHPRTTERVEAIRQGW